MEMDFVGSICGVQSPVCGWLFTRAIVSKLCKINLLLALKNYFGCKDQSIETL